MHLLLMWALLATTVTDPAASTNTRLSVQTTALKAKSASFGDAVTPEMQLVMQTMNSRDYVAASAKLQPILTSCKAKDQSSKPTLVSVADTAEFLRYSASAKLKPAVEGDLHKDIDWVRDDCALAYKTAAFLYADANDAQDALVYLDLASHRAPYWAEVYAERGFILMHSGDSQSALAAYDRAIELANEFPSSAYIKPVALRGLGFVHTETGKLDLAQKAYEDSLQIEPGNELAKHELQYIAGLRKHQQSTQPSSNGTPTP